MKKRMNLAVSVFLLALVLALGLPSGASATERTHVHCVCGGNETVNHAACEDRVWTGLTSLADMLSQGILTKTGDGKYSWTKAGDYYLAESFDIDGIVTILKDTTVSLCLNGKTLSGSTDHRRMFSIYGDFNITDCNHRSMWGTMNARCVESDTAKVYGSIFYQMNATSDGTEALVNTVNIYGGKFVYSGEGQSTSGGLIYLGNSKPEGALSTLNIYDGILSGGRASGEGGAICVSNKSVVNMYGGRITDCESGGLGGGVIVYVGSSLNVYGGELSDCQSGTDGGIIYAKGTVYLKDCTLSGGVALREGGNICIATGALVETEGEVLITGGTGTGGGNIMSFGSLRMNGGTVSLGSCGNRGGNVYLFNKGDAELTGTSLLCGKASYGGNLFVGCNNNSSASTAYASLKNCEVLDGHADVGGGNIVACNSGTVELELTRVEEGTAINLGGNIYAYCGESYKTAGYAIGSILVSNSRVTGGVCLSTGDSIYCKYPLTLSGLVRITTEGDARNPGLYLGTGYTVDGSNLGPGSLVDITVGDRSQPFSLSSGGAQYFRSYSGLYDVVARDGKLYLHEPMVAVYQGEQELGQYHFLRYAAQYEATDTTYIKLLSDRTESFTMTEDVYLDLNGYTLSGAIELDGNRLYGMDTTTNGYDGSGAGRLAATITDGGKTAAPMGDTRVEADRAGSIYRYLAVPEESGYSFHRFYLGVNTVKLWTTHAGISYRSVLMAGPQVLEQLDESAAYGLVLSLDGPPETLNTYSAFGAGDLTAGKANVKTTGLYNILETGNAGNGIRAEQTVYCRAYLQTGEGHVVFSRPVAMSLRQVVELIDSRYDLCTDTEKAYLNQMYARYADVMSGWELENIGKQET